MNTGQIQYAEVFQEAIFLSRIRNNHPRLQLRDWESCMPGWIPGALRNYQESAFSSNIISVCEIRHTFLVQKQMTHCLVTGINDLTFEEGSRIVKFVSIMSKCMKQCFCLETDSRLSSKVMPRRLWA